MNTIKELFTPVYKRILLKITGETFGGKRVRGIDFPAIRVIAEKIVDLQRRSGIEIAIVVGAGNLFRGRSVRDREVDRSTADYIGMLGTVMNSLALQEELESFDATTRVMSSLYMQSVCEPYVRRKAIRHLEKGRIVILAGGTGKPFFTTDSAAALSACELHCDVLLKATNVDGVYSHDPATNPDAQLYTDITYDQAINQNLRIMDDTAFSLCRSEQIPIIVFNIQDADNIGRILKGDKIGTVIGQEK